jgi:TRAP-type C4-dicarboxylate transport system permease small subunit
MKLQMIVAIVLIILGVLGLAYGSFDITQATHTADLGSVQLSLDEKKNINVPIWASVLTIVAGGVLLVWRKKS